MCALNACVGYRSQTFFAYYRQIHCCRQGIKTVVGTYIACRLLLPDMLGGRYPTVAQGGNPSHRVDMGIEFFKEIEETLKENGLMIVQLSAIPYDLGCTFDVVLQKIS